MNLNEALRSEQWMWESRSEFTTAFCSYWLTKHITCSLIIKCWLTHAQLAVLRSANLSGTLYHCSWNFLSRNNTHAYSHDTSVTKLWNNSSIKQIKKHKLKTELKKTHKNCQNSLLYPDIWSNAFSNNTIKKQYTSHGSTCTYPTTSSKWSKEITRSFNWLSQLTQLHRLSGYWILQ